jgi:uncharacterized membrane protein YeaQ/YmgE (transglycosylase-associated protein family)
VSIETFRDRPPRREEQIWEALNRASARSLLATLLQFPRASPRIRIRTRHGTEVECEFGFADLEADSIVGSGFHGARVEVRISDVTGLWVRRPRMLRFVGIWAAMVLIGALVGGWLVDGSSTLELLDGVLLGIAAGAVGAAVAVWLLQDWRALRHWKALFGAPAA